MIAEGKPGAKRLYEGLVAEAEAIPELAGPLTDLSVLKKHELLVGTLLSTIFTPSAGSTQSMYAVALPFRAETIILKFNESSSYHYKRNRKELIVPEFFLIFFYLLNKEEVLIVPLHQVFLPRIFLNGGGIGFQFLQGFSLLGYLGTQVGLAFP